MSSKKGPSTTEPPTDQLLEASTKTRKSPKQERAKQTVDRVLQATTELIIANGLETLSTNKIAEAANVNIASLYQYFPNKDAIVSALIEDNIKNMIEVMNTELEDMMDLPVKEAARQWLSTGVALYRQSEGLTHNLIKSFNSTNPFPGADQIEKRLIEVARKFTMRRRDKIIVEDVNVAIYVSFNSAMLVLFKHLQDPNSYLKDEEVIDGIAEMLSRYMEGT